MPQISKIRIANFQYNDGKRLIADELYDFESENKGPSDVLINLANGGGKSVLVQLMMQPIIPKAKVAGRRIESFFKKATDHCYVAIEWSLDNSKMKLMTGIAMSASDASGDSDSERGFQIKYYTFISSYQNYQGNYNIVTLPLSRKENGKYIPAAFDEVRNLAKKSSGALERYSSDDSVKWQERLSQYGIVQNEWRMIEELNSNEDGLSKYFSNLRGSDAVIDRLIIPRIEEKQNQRISGDDSSLETMLISYAKQFSRQQKTIEEREITGGFCSMLGQTRTEAEELWRENDSFEKCVERLFAYSDALDAEVSRNRALSESIETRKTRLIQDIRHIEQEKVSAEYYVCKRIFESENANLQSARNIKNEAADKADKARKRLLLIECAHYYSQLKDIEGQIAAITAEMNDRENNSETGNRLASLKYSACIAIKAELERIAPELEQVTNDKNSCKAAIDELVKELAALRRSIEKARSDVNRTDAFLEKQREDDSALVYELGIGAVRMLDGRYRDDELLSWQKEMQAKEQSVLTELSSNREKLRTLEERKDAIPQETANAANALKEIRSEVDESTRKLDEFHAAENSVKAVLQKYNLDYALRFTADSSEYLSEQIAATGASAEDEKRKISAAEEAIAAVNRGTLHIPKLLSEYLDSAGLHYTTFEQYLLNQQENQLLSKAACRQLLMRYPYAAYGVIMSEPDRALLCQEAEGKWLPAVLPVFTDSDVEKLLSNETDPFHAVAAYSKEYFSDRASYELGLKDTLAKQNERKAMLEERVKSLNADKSVIDAFAAYDDQWESRITAETEKLKKSADKTQAHIAALLAELRELKERIGFAESEEKRLESELRDTQSRLSEFEKLSVRLQEEENLSQALEKAETALGELQDSEESISSQKAEKEDKFRQSEARLNELETYKKALKDGCDVVAEADETELIPGAWDSLLSQYKTTLDIQNDDLKRLAKDKSRLLDESRDKQKEIRKRGCDKSDYEQLVYSEEAEADAANYSRFAEIKSNEAYDAFSKAEREQIKAEISFKNAEKKLAEYGGALPESEVGNAFDDRIAENRSQLDGLENQKKTLDAALSKLEKTQGKAESATASYNRPQKYKGIELEADYAAQLTNLTIQLRDLRDSVLKSERKVEDSFKKMAEIYGASPDVAHAIGNMREILSNVTIQGDRYYTLCTQIDFNLHMAGLRISQIDTDLKEFHKTRDDLIHQCLIQGKQIYEGLKQLSNNSRVMVQGRRRQMLKFDIPDAVDENVAIANISAEIDKGTNEIVSKIAAAHAESDIRKTASATVGSSRLIRRYISADNIVLKAYKIDRNPDNSGYRTWEQTQVNNSGAEKFVVYFAVILALMAYTRDGYDDTCGKNTSVLVLDNPFGPISSKHVLEPMFEISKNYDV